MSEHVSTTDVQVRYGETDQMGIAHHGAYLLWCELGRTQHMKGAGVSYRELEEQGILLPVAQAKLRYRAPAYFEDLLTVRCWVRRIGSRLVEFGNAIERTRDRELLATAQITLVAISAKHEKASIPKVVQGRLIPVPDPVRS